MGREIANAAWSSPFSGDAGVGSDDQFVEFRFHITPDERLQIQKVSGRKAVDTNFAAGEKTVVAEFDLVA